MEISLLLAQQILQLFLILLMGYAVVRCGLLKAADSRVLSVVMVYLALPCVVLKAFQIDDSPALRTGLLYAFAIAVLLHLLFLALTAVLKRPLHLDVIEGATLIYSNAAALVIPAGTGPSGGGVRGVLLRLRHRAADSAVDPLQHQPAGRRGH